MFYTYILHLNNNQLYTGYSSNIKRRVREHNDGKVEFTSNHLPAKLIHYECYPLKSDAIRREKFLKSTEGKKSLRKQIKDILNKIDYR